MIRRELRPIPHRGGIWGTVAALAVSILALGVPAWTGWTERVALDSFLTVTGQRPTAVTRILSANVASDEILLSIAPERVIGVSTLADDPRVSNVVREASLRTTKVTGDIEQVLAADPSLVVLGAHNVDLARQVEEFGIRVIMLSGYESIEWIRTVIRTLGREADVADRAETVIATMDRRIQAVTDRVAGRPRPLVLSYSESGYVPGRQTTMDEVIGLAGGESLSGQLGFEGWQVLSQEQVIVNDPEVILLRGDAEWEADFHRQLTANPAFRDTRAVRNGRVYLIPGRLMVTGSHYIAETVEMLARVLHPDAFRDR